MDPLPFADPLAPAPRPLFLRTSRDADKDARAELTAFVREQHRKAERLSEQARILERILVRRDRGA